MHKCHFRLLSRGWDKPQTMDFGEVKTPQKSKKMLTTALPQLLTRMNCVATTLIKLEGNYGPLITHPASSPWPFTMLCLISYITTTSRHGQSGIPKAKLISSEAFARLHLDLTFNNDALGRLLDAPNDNGSVQASRGHQSGVGTPRDAIHFGSVETPDFFAGHL